jgi:acetyl esterase/lipase
MAWVGPIGSPGRGVSTKALGAAPWAYEVGFPSGRWRGRPARGLMLLIHGGGWYIVGPGPLSTERAEADRWRRRGWLTVNLDYPACGRSLAGVLWFHDRIRARYGRRLPLCASGASAGGHLALMLAVRRRDVGCVVGQGTPTDLRTIARDASAGGSREGSRAVFDMGRNAFGERRLAAMSPAAQTATLRARVLLALARRDNVIPLSQAPALRRAILRRRPRAYVQSMVLTNGRIPWIHAPVTAAALRRLYAAELRLVAPLLRVRGG